MSAVDGIHGFRSQETSHYSYQNRGVYRHGYQSGYDGRCGYMSQDAIHSPYRNFGAIVDVDGRGGYRSQTSHSSFRNPGGHGIFLGVSFSSLPVY